MDKFRACERFGRWVVETEMPCINGLIASVTVADTGSPDPSDQMCAFDPEAWARRICAALNAAPASALAEKDARIAELERERDRIIGLQQELSCKNATIETFHRGVLDAHKENERLKERIAELEDAISHPKLTPASRQP